MYRIIILIFLFPIVIFGQNSFHFPTDKVFTEKDTLRGMLSPARTCFDVTHYNLDIDIDVENQSINGFVDMTYLATEEFLTLQLDLFSNMKINKIVRLDTDKELKYKRRFNAFFVNMGDRIAKGESKTIRIYYEGSPVIAKRAPWDGGFVWSKDDENRDWIAVACEGDGASLWWPNKDHLSDEPDSMKISITVPDHLTCISNGQLVSTIKKENNKAQFNWKVTYPINNYNVTLNIGHYDHFSDIYTNPDGEELDLDYYVMDYNLEKAQKHFKQVNSVLSCFEHYFGPYPFWNDGYALVETPYLGMEHQGAIAYGNKYKRGYLGRMIPSDMNFDYIIVHETGHEYFGNSISCNDHAEMWIHESFTTYMEALYVECTRGYEDGVRYLNYQRRFIENNEPIVGPLDVNWTSWESSDQYYKGAWVLHTLRHAINNDELWWEILKEFHQKNLIKNIDSKDFFDFIELKTGKDYLPFFTQYLYHAKIPTFQYSLKKKGKKYFLKYKWTTNVENFEMPLAVTIKDKKVLLKPTNNWKKAILNIQSKKEFIIHSDLFLIDEEKID